MAAIAYLETSGNVLIERKIFFLLLFLFKEQQKLYALSLLELCNMKHRTVSFVYLYLLAVLSVITDELKSKS